MFCMAMKKLSYKIYQAEMLTVRLHKSERNCFFERQKCIASNLIFVTDSTVKTLCMDQYPEHKQRVERKQNDAHCILFHARSGRFARLLLDVALPIQSDHGLLNGNMRREDEEERRGRWW